ncbi:hypothetical protein [Halobacteriovorax sp.]|uniref:hypothetical protein n=1 Tax=Halobacteriovorax sp. TaxID=2020862 RepID=UPI003567960E
MTFKNIAILVSALALTACTSVKMKDTPKQYSKETVRSFEEIERENALERYRQLRLQNWERTKKGKVSNTRPRRYYSPSKPRKKTAPKKIVAPKKIIIPTNPEEQKIEVDQNIKFFCMEKRKDPRFKSSMSCESYTANILSACEDSYQWNDKKLTNCVKSKLK